jgi:hypothetical protein
VFVVSQRHVAPGSEKPDRRVRGPEGRMCTAVANPAPNDNSPIKTISELKDLRMQKFMTFENKRVVCDNLSVTSRKN